MRTNLVFKRTINIEGSSRTEMKIIEVNIPELKIREGWTLVSSADKVEQIKLDEDTPTPITFTSTTDAATDFLNNLTINVSNASAQSPKDVIEKSASQSVGFTGKGDIKLGSQIQEEAVNIATIDSQDIKKEMIGFTNHIPEGPIPTSRIDKNIEDASKLVKNKDFSRVRDFESPVSGTACLIRTGEIIRIAYREGKKANITGPNKVCISDKDKQSFFNAVRACNPTDIISKWVLTPKDHHYRWWNEFIDNEYKEQKATFIREQKYKK